MVTNSKDEAPFKNSVSMLYKQIYHRHFTSFKNMENIDFREKKLLLKVVTNLKNKAPFKISVSQLYKQRYCTHLTSKS